MEKNLKGLPRGTRPIMLYTTDDRRVLLYYAQKLWPKESRSTIMFRALYEMVERERAAREAAREKGAI